MHSAGNGPCNLTRYLPRPQPNLDPVPTRPKHLNLNTLSRLLAFAYYSTPSHHSFQLGVLKTIICPPRKQLPSLCPSIEAIRNQIISSTAPPMAANFMAWNGHDINPGRRAVSATAPSNTPRRPPTRHYPLDIPNLRFFRYEHHLDTCDIMAHRIMVDFMHPIRVPEATYATPVKHPVEAYALGASQRAQVCVLDV